MATSSHGTALKIIIRHLTEDARALGLTHCDCGRPWTKSHTWLRTPNVCRPCDKLRPHFDSDPPFGQVDPNEEDDPETTTGGWCA